jgi:hypothetical protein
MVSRSGPERSTRAALAVGFIIALLLMGGAGPWPNVRAGSAPPAAPEPPLLAGGSVLTFQESGLPTGTLWRVSTWPYDAPGPQPATSSSTTSTLVAAADESTGATDFETWTIPSGNGTYWVPAANLAPPVGPSAGPINVTFERVKLAGTQFGLHVLPQGLPTGLNWSMTVNGTGYGSNDASQEIRLIANHSFNANAPTIYLSNGTAFAPVGYELLPCTLNNSWQNFTTGPFALVLRGPAYLLVVYQLQYRLTSVASVGGSVTPGSEWAAADVPIELNATASAGFNFLGWSGTGAGAINSSLPGIAVTPNGPVEELASFVPYRYTIVVHAIGLPGAQVFSVLYDGSPYSSYNGSIVLPALPASLYSLTVPFADANDSPSVRYVALNVSSSLPILNSSLITLDGNGTVNVTFVPQFGLVLTTTGGGTISPAVGEYWEATGTPVAISATPSPGWYFGGWTGNGSGSQTSSAGNLVLALGGPVNESARFVPGVQLYDLSITEAELPIGTNWSVSVGSLGAQGATASLTVADVPAGSYLLSVPELSTGPGVRYEVENVTELGVTVPSAGPVTIDFAPEYYVGASAAPGGTVSPSPGWKASGSVVTFSAAPNAGYQFLEWQGTVTSNSSGLAVTVTGPINETAVFETPAVSAPVAFPWYDDAAAFVGLAAVTFGVGFVVWRRGRAPAAGSP